jgi:DNA-binding SARP family transcriptional activator
MTPSQLEAPIVLPRLPVQRIGGEPETGRVHFGILGPLTVWRGTEPITPRSAAHRTLLSILLLAEDRPVTADRLLDLVWGEDPPASGRACVQVAICRLRDWLERNADGAAVLESDGAGYWLRVAPDALDLHWFRAAIEDADEAEGRARVAALEGALTMWRGAALADSGLAASLTSALDRLRRDAACALADAALVAGQPQRSLEHLDRLAADAPFDEGLQATYAIILAECGRQADAFAAIERCRTLLAEELGVDPGQQLRDAHARVLRQGTEETVEVDLSEVFGLPCGSARLVLRAGVDAEDIVAAFRGA